MHTFDAWGFVVMSGIVVMLLSWVIALRFIVWVFELFGIGPR